jgi:hypothetical protein
VQRAAVIARHDLALGNTRLLPRLFRRQQQKGIDLRVERLDAREQRVGQLHRRELALLDQAGHVCDRQPMQVRRR